MFSTAFAAHAEGGRVFPDAASVEPLRVGHVIPDVSVRTIDGETVDLVKQIGDRGALLVFYRGGW
jgi:hypothetical protein